MPKPFQVRVFGKTGCQKCHALNQRVDKLLETEEWKDFEKLYCDLETEDGLVMFSESECIAPGRIPALVVARWNAQSGEYEPVHNPRPSAAADPVCGRSRLYQYVGLQTDYSAEGRGVITPRMVSSVMAAARG